MFLFFNHSKISCVCQGMKQTLVRVGAGSWRWGAVAAVGELRGKDVALPCFSPQPLALPSTAALTRLSLASTAASAASAAIARAFNARAASPAAATVGGRGAAASSTDASSSSNPATAARARVWEEETEAKAASRAARESVGAVFGVCVGVGWGRSGQNREANGLRRPRPPVPSPPPPHALHPRSTHRHQASFYPMSPSPLTWRHDHRGVGGRRRRRGRRCWHF